VSEHPYQAFLREAMPATTAHQRWTPDDGILPALYLSHGAPPLLESPRWMGELLSWSLSLPKPKDILIVSAHWESAPLNVSQAAAGTPLVYDFSGFDPLYNRLTYPTPDATALAERVVAAMPDSEPVHRHPRRGLDHGAWVPLMVMYPAADVPVLQLSMPSHDPQRLMEIGSRLRPLREEGTLVIGSGFMTHGLPFLTYEQFLGKAPEPTWSRDFDAWAARALAAGDVDELAAYADRAPGMPFAHPTVEHYVPLFVTLGAAAAPDRGVKTSVEGYFFGLSKRSFQAA
jgi:4,5-DOPA dioxygenase extradiol